MKTIDSGFISAMAGESTTLARLVRFTCLNGRVVRLSGTGRNETFQDENFGGIGLRSTHESFACISIMRSSRLDSVTW